MATKKKAAPKEAKKGARQQRLPEMEDNKYDAPDLEVSEAIKDLLWVHSNNGSHLDANRDILEAYRRGREAGAK